MRLLSRIGIVAAACALVAFMPARAEALLLTQPADCDAPHTPGWNNEDFLASCGATGLTLQYNNGGQTNTDSGPFALSYTTTVGAEDASGQDITVAYDGLPDPVLDCTSLTCWLIIKDGQVANPSWLGWDISGWDGLESISIPDVYPGQGSLSHLSIFSGAGTGGGGGGTGGGGGGVPEPATLSLLGLGMLGAAWRARRRRVG